MMRFSEIRQNARIFKNIYMYPSKNLLRINLPEIPKFSDLKAQASREGPKQMIADHLGAVQFDKHSASLEVINCTV